MSEFLSVGQFRCRFLDGGAFRVDGGAMFGVVPRVLWEKRVQPDGLNRVALAMNPLLIVGPTHTILVDPGIGPREAERFGDHYHIARPRDLEERLMEAGVTTDAVDMVINTHLHWDHSGSNMAVVDGGRVVPAFSNAVYYVQEGEWNEAVDPCELTRASYLMQAEASLARSGQLTLVQGEREIVTGVRLVPTPGHTPHHQSVCIESEGQTLFYLGDVIPTTAHLPLPYITALDLEPRVTLETKRWILHRARAENWQLAFCHDPAQKLLRLSEDDG
ncbi:MAG: MBL fold metallo-hydrolase [bacterium]|nr:MBL fold metallo-hydrolase [bacterium]